jgi:transposase
LAESYREENGRVKQRTIASLGRVEKIDAHFDSVIRGLRRATGREPAAANGSAIAPDDQVNINFEPTRTLGDVWTLTQIWKELGFDRLASVFRSSKRKLDVEAMIRVMVFNRLCDPESKLGVLRWLDTVCIPGIDTGDIAYQHLLRSMDELMDKCDEVDQVISSLLRPLIDQELSVVFYDLTTIKAEGESEQEDEVRRYGMSKDGGIKRQFFLGVVQTAEGLPIYHEVFDGNVAEVSTLKNTLETVMERFTIKRVIAVADRGLLSMNNLAELQAMKTPGGEPLEFILAVPGRRYSEFETLMAPFHEQHYKGASEEIIAELDWQDLRLVVAHDPYTAGERTAGRDLQIKKLEDAAADWVNKLEEQEGGKRYRGRKLSDGGARARFYHEVVESRLAKIIKVNLKSDLFSYDIDRKARSLAEMMDGKLLLVSNTPDLTPKEIVLRYKSLADIERGFRVLKSELEIGPVFHRLPDRTRAHASICFMALIIHRIIRQRLKQSSSSFSPERALETLRRIQRHRITLNDKTHTGISTLSDEQGELLGSLNVDKPIESKQLSLL